MQERTEAEIIAKAPISLQLGDVEYKVRPLGITKGQAWREQAVEAVKSIVSVHQEECTGNDAFTRGLAFFFLRFPEKMLDLVLAYAPNLPREVVAEEATDEQLARAFGQVVAIAFPFTKELGMISQVMGIATNFPR